MGGSWRTTSSAATTHASRQINDRGAKIVCELKHPDNDPEVSVYLANLSLTLLRVPNSNVLLLDGGHDGGGEPLERLIVGAAPANVEQTVDAVVRAALADPMRQANGESPRVIAYEIR